MNGIPKPKHLISLQEVHRTVALTKIQKETARLVSIAYSTFLFQELVLDLHILPLGFSLFEKASTWVFDNILHSRTYYEKPRSSTGTLCEITLTPMVFKHIRNLKLS